jgi:pSer/pThr/pTyr-binding forkhead associated (FHA) protein
VVELKVLSGKQAGANVVARRFPFHVGRAADSALRLEDDGVFERHFSIQLKSKDGFFLTSDPPAVSAVNNQPVTEARLRSGDVIQAGSASLTFSLSPMRQHALRPRELFVWVILGVLCLFQIAVIYWLLEH